MQWVSHPCVGRFIYNKMEKQIFKVSEVNEYIKNKLELDMFLKGIYVVGEISNYTISAGNIFFSLKDVGGVLNVVMFNSYAQKLKFAPKNGMKVVVFGYVTVFVKRGSYQLSAFSMEPDGIGSLFVAFEQLKERLSKEGLFSSEYKKKIPRFPTSIGIVTSAKGAAVHDMLNISRRRFPMCDIIIYSCQVQGEKASKTICEGVEYFDKEKNVDLIIVGRGGGSFEELSVFNDETLARTIFKCSIPVISAVGHETDFSISDFVSDLRAPTPSAAIELSLPDAKELKWQLSILSKRMQNSLNNKFLLRKKQFDNIIQKQCFVSKQKIFDDKRLFLNKKTTELVDKFNFILEYKKRLLYTCVAKLDALSPLSVMSRGYSLVSNEDGVSVTSIEDIKLDQILNIRFTDGLVSTVVKEVTGANNK